jgi:hypothetical protein
MFPLRHRKKRRNFFRRTEHRRYQARPFQNPYFSQAPRKNLLPFAVVGLALGIIVAVGSFLLTSARFEITAVSVQGAHSVNPRAIRETAEAYLAETRWIAFRASNRFLFDENALRDRLGERFAFERLAIDREGGVLRIEVEEKVSTLVWTSDDASYLVDAHGLVIRTLLPDELSALMNPPPIQGPVREGESHPDDRTLAHVIDLTESDVKVGGTVMSDQEVAFVLAFLEGLRQMEIGVSQLQIDRTVGAWMKAVTLNDFDILFDPTQDALVQLGNLAVFLSEQASSPGMLEYIDLRFGDHVYFK